MVRAIAGAAVLSVLAFSPVYAVPITDTVDPAPNVYLSSGGSQSSYTFVHDITGSSDFQIGDIISSASIAIRLAELVTTGENNETFLFTIGPQTVPCSHGNCVTNPGRLDILSLTAAALSDLASDGKIEFTIQASSGDFFFADSTLTAEVSPGIRDPNEPGSASVPVPSTLLLLGAGLMGLGLRSRSSGAQPA